MVCDHLEYLEVLNCHFLVAHLTCHTHSFEHLGGIRAGADRTGSAKAVVLAMSALAYATETVTLYHTLETFTLRGTLDVDEVILIEEVDCDGVTEIVLAVKSFELGQVALGSYSGFLEVAGHGSGGVLVLLLYEAKLHGLITVFVSRFNLSNYAGAYFDNSARHVLAVGTENGCHSDFLS